MSLLFFESKWKAFAFAFIMGGMAFAQNLVLNPSFENVNLGSLQCSWYTTVPQFNSAINNWTLPTGGSTDIFHTSLATSCYCSPFSTNASSPGQQAPRTGNCFVNIVTYGNGGCSPWREYIQGQLSTPLIAGQTYEVEMYVSLADNMSVGTNNIGVKFSTTPYTQGSNCGYYTTPDLNYTGPIIIDKQNWTQIIFCYTPTQSGLQNFIIGNFYNDVNTSTQSAGGGSGNTIRYFVDDVRIEAVTIGGNAGTNGTASVCQGDPAINLFNSLGGTPSQTGTWSGPSTLTGGYLGTFDPAVNSPGTYTYSVAGGGLCGSGSPSSATVTVSLSSSNATITPAGPFCVQDAAVQLSAVDPGGTWSGIGITDAVNGTFDPSVAGTGVHTITYTIGGTCGDVQTSDITVNATYDATITPAGPFCTQNAAVQLSAVDPGGTWSGTGITDAVNGTFDPAIAGVGSHLITYTIGGNCGDIQTTTIDIVPDDNVAIDPVGAMCFGSSVVTLTAGGFNGTWTGNGIIDQNTGDFDPSVAGSGLHSITFTSNGLCPGTASLNVEVLPQLSVFAFQDETICAGELANLSATASGGDGNYSFSWVDQNGTQMGNNSTLNVDPVITTNYTVTVTDACGTSPVSADVLITVIPIPVIDFTVDNNAGCAPLNVVFTNASNPGGTNCVWDFGDGQSSSSCGAVSHQYTNVGCYDVTLTVTQNNCSNSQTIADMVCVADEALADFTVNPQITDVFDTEFEFTNLSLNADTYSWSFGDGTFGTEVNPVHIYPDQEGLYTICLTAQNAFGCNDEICKTITIQEGLIFYLPNTFTPDGDAFNQTFSPVFTSGFDPFDFNLLIFNRWGEVIWESNDASIGWDGTYRVDGTLVPDGTYVWRVEFKTLKNDERITQTGHVNLIR